jgi:hypothetical protein
MRRKQLSPPPPRKILDPPLRLLYSTGTFLLLYRHQLPHPASYSTGTSLIQPPTLQAPSSSSLLLYRHLLLIYGHLPYPASHSMGTSRIRPPTLWAPPSSGLPLYGQLPHPASSLIRPPTLWALPLSGLLLYRHQPHLAWHLPHLAS